MSETNFVNRVSLTPGLKRDLDEISQSEPETAESARASHVGKVEAPHIPSVQELQQTRTSLDNKLPILQQVLKNKQFQNRDTSASLVKKPTATVSEAVDTAKAIVNTALLTEERVREIVREEFQILLDKAAVQEQHVRTEESVGVLPAAPDAAEVEGGAS